MKGVATLWILLGTLMAGCADRVAGKGVASETTNGIEVSGVLRDSLARPLAGRMVELRDPDRDLTLADGRTDAEGSWRLLAPRPARYLLRSLGDSVGAILWITVGVADRQAAPPLTASRLRVLRGRIASGPVDPVGLAVRLPGAGSTGIVLSDSSFSIPGLPDGWHFATFHDPATGATVGEAAFSTWNTLAVHLPLDTRVRLDDFEGNQGESRLQPLLDGAWWGRWNDTSMIADSARTWAGVTGLYADSATRLGRSLRVPMLVGEAISGRPDLVRSAGLVIKLGGVENLDSASVWHSLSRVDSIVFWAKGSGTIQFRVKSRSSVDPLQAGHFQTEFVLTSSWVRHAFAPGDLPSAEGLDWRTSQARELQWTSRDAIADLWLDDIELAGVAISDFLRP